MKDLFKILELIVAIILSAILIPFGMLFNIWDLIRFKRRFWKIFFRFLYEIILIALDIFERIAIITDRIGNVILGNALTWFFVKRQFYNQLYFNPYGSNRWTVSAATGYFSEKNLINKNGFKFNNLLSKVFGKDHCKRAYEFQLLKNNLLQEQE